MQRIGRVDRRMNPKVEEKLLQDHPELAGTRNKVSFWTIDMLGDEFLDTVQMGDPITIHEDGTVEVG